MSDTPRTDTAAFHPFANGFQAVSAEFSRQLERELAAVKDDLDFTSRAFEETCQQLAAMTAKRDALEEALEKCARIIGPPDCETWADDFEIDAAWEAAQKALATHGKASDATPNLEETRSKLGVENQYGQETLPCSAWVEVSKDDFDQYISNYPNPLEKDIARMCEPPMLTYNDFSEGKVWPQSVVAKVQLYDGSKYHGGRTPVYFLPNPSGQERGSVS